MQFLMLLYRDRLPIDETTPELDEDDVEAWVTRMDARGARLAGDPLRLDADAVTVRVRGGSTRREDGAYLDTGNTLIGFDLLECHDIDEAVAVAAEHPMAAGFALELRPVVEP